MATRKSSTAAIRTSADQTSAGKAAPRAAKSAAAKKRAKSSAAAAGTSAAGKPARKAVTKKAATKKTASKPKRVVKPAASKRAAPKSSRTNKSTAPVVRTLSHEERDRRCLRLIHAACLKTGSSAMAAALVGSVPMLGRLAPVLLGSLADSKALPKIQRRLVLDILELYEIRLNELEERAVVLLATAVGSSAREISQRSVEQMVEQSGIQNFGGMIGRPIIARLLPLATLAGEGAATITSTYAIGRRAQALCRIGNGQANDLGELLHGLTGIDQRLLISWSGSAFRMAITPFRAALGALGGSTASREQLR